MVRQKILTEPRRYTKSGSMTKLKKKPREYDPMKTLLDEQLISKAIWVCLKDNDPDGVIEVLEAHFRAKNKSEVAREQNLPRTTMCHAFKNKNPTLHTLAKLVHAVYLNSDRL